MLKPTFRGLALTAQQEYDRAIKDFDEAIRLEPNDSFAFLSRGNAWGYKQEHDRAIKNYDEAIRLDPQNATAFFNRGLAGFNKKDYARAIKDFEETSRLDPENAQAYGAVAWLKASCAEEKYRDGKEAIKLATKACELTAWKVGNWIEALAAAYAEAGDFEKAVKYEKQALQDSDYAKTFGKEGRARLKLYEAGKPFRGTKSNE